MEDPIRGEKQHLNALPRPTEVKDNVRCSTFMIKRTLHCATVGQMIPATTEGPRAHPKYKVPAPPISFGAAGSIV